MRPKQGPFQNPSTQKTPFKDDFLQHTNLFNACRVYLNTKFIKILSIQVTDVTAEVSNTRPAMLFGNFQIINIYVAKCLENRCREIIESKLNDTQCGFRPGRGSTDPHFILQQNFEKSWGYVKDVFTCFVDLEKTYDRFPSEKHCGVLPEYGVDGRLLLAVKLLYSCSEVYVHVGRVKSPSFTFGVGLRQRCVLSSLLFIVYISGSQPFP